MFDKVMTCSETQVEAPILQYAKRRGSVQTNGTPTFFLTSTGAIVTIKTSPGVRK